MKFCENCGARLEDSAAFCGNCGTKATEQCSAEEEKIFTQQSGDDAEEKSTMFWGLEESSGSAYSKNLSSKRRNMWIVCVIIGLLAVIMVGTAIRHTAGKKTSNTETSEVNDDIEFDDNTKGATDNTEKEKAGDIAGKLTGSEYENEVFGVGCRLDNWNFLSEEELFAQVEASKAVFKNSDDEDLQKMIEENNSILVMSAVNGSERNVNLTIGKIDENAKVFYDMGEDKLLTFLGIDVKNYYQSAGFDIQKGGCIESELGGTKKYALRYVCTNPYGVTVCVEQFIFLIDDYNAVLTITVPSEEELAEIHNNFYLL